VKDQITRSICDRDARSEIFHLRVTFEVEGCADDVTPKTLVEEYRENRRKLKGCSRILDLAVEPIWRKNEQYNGLYPRLAQQTIVTLSKIEDANISEFPVVALQRKVISGLTSYQSLDRTHEEEWIAVTKKNQQMHWHALLRDSIAWEEWIKEHDSRKCSFYGKCVVGDKTSKYKFNAGPSGPPVPSSRHKGIGNSDNSRRSLHAVESSVTLTAPGYHSADLSTKIMMKVSPSRSQTEGASLISSATLSPEMLESAVMELKTSDGGDGGDGESGNFVEHSEKFREMKLSPSKLFFDDLTMHIGIPKYSNVLHAMRCEHERDKRFQRKTGEDLTVNNSHQMQFVHPPSEWNIVLKGEPQDYLINNQTPHYLNIPLREVGNSLQYYFESASKLFEDLESPERLLKEEVLALRLWSGPMNSRYAYFFRKINTGVDQDTKTKYPAAAVDPTAVKYDCPYVTTLHAINSGVIKLSQIWKLPPNRKVYRGFKNIGPVSTELPDIFGCTGGVEPCVLATTSSSSKADHYSTGGFKLEIEVGQVNKGADIRWLSQFPHECEVLFPALSNIEFLPLQGQCARSCDDGVGCKREDVASESAELAFAAVPVYRVCITANSKRRSQKECNEAQTAVPTPHDEPGA
jgi:hypothetical protein